MLQDPAGVVNEIIGLFGIAPQPWLGSTRFALISIVALTLWQGVGYSMIIFLAGLQDIPRVYYEAARIDGAGAVARFLDITLHQIKDVLLVVALLRTIFMFNNFEIVFLLTGGGPLRATMTLPILVYEQAFGVYEMGRGSAIAVVMFLILIAVMTVYFAFLRKEAD
jgi:multiple sugar transport system permease protein